MRYIFLLFISQRFMRFFFLNSSLDSLGQSTTYSGFNQLSVPVHLLEQALKC